MRSIIKTKKAQGFEAWFFVIVALFAFAIFFIVLNKVWGEIKTPLGDRLQESIGNNTDVNITKVTAQVTSSGLLFDKLIPFLIIGLFGFVMILAGSIIKHPIMIFVGIIILGILVLLGVVYSNVYNELTSSDAFVDTKASMPIQDKFMQYLPIIAFLAALGGTIAIIFSKSQQGYGGGI